MKSEENSKLLSAILITVLLAGICVMSNQVIAASRGISINLRAAERADAPISESVTLYEASYALVIGNDAYNNGWPRLTNAVKDAVLIAAVLEEKGFEVELRKNLNSDQLNAVFKRFFILKGNDPSSRLFVWYAGHGQTLDGEGYLVPVDAPVPSKGAEFKFSAVALRDFGTYMRQALSKHAYAVFDSCFAGSVFTSQRAMPPAAITRATTLPVRQFLTSGDADQTVSDDGSFRELFIRAVMGEERSDANGDGYVTASELGMFMGDRVTNLTQSMQTPRYGKLRDKNYDRGDFVFVLPQGATGSGALELAPKAAPLQASAEITFWKSIQNSDSIGQFDAYLKQYPQGSFTALAMVRKTELQQKLQQARKAVQAREVFEVAFLDRDFEATKVANVRKNPFPTAQKVARLEKGALVWGIGETDTKGGKWYKVARDGLELGFVYSLLLKESARVDTEVAVESLSIPAVVSEPVPSADPGAQQSELTAKEQELLVTPAKPESTDQRLSSLMDDLLNPVEQEVVGIVVSAENQPASRVNASSNAGRSFDQSGGTESLAGRSAVSNAAAARAERPPLQSTSVISSAAIPAASTPGASLDLSTEPAAIPAGAAEKSILVDDLEEKIAAQPAPSLGGESVQIIRQPDAVASVTPPRQSAQQQEELALLETDVKTSPETETSNYIEQYITAAEAGNVRAQTSLAYMYETGQRVAVNKQQAIFWYRQAAEQGDIQAQLNLALMYQNGDGITQDLTEAAFWFRKAAVEGDPDAQQTVGYMYENGHGLVKDIAEAASWYSKAAEQGKVAAQNNLGRLFQLGLGVPKDTGKAMFWYGKAVDQGSEAAKKNLSDLTR